MTVGALRLVLEAVVTVLRDRGIPYHVTGGLVSSYYGEPRLTQDVDFVVRLAPSDARVLTEDLSHEFFVDRERLARAVETSGMFQALHREQVIKADFHVGESVPGELGRSRTVQLFEGLDVRIVSKEDAILSKLLWVKKGSARSRGDVLGMLLDPTPTDELLLEDLAEKLDCADLLRQIRSEAGQL